MSRVPLSLQMPSELQGLFGISVNVMSPWPSGSRVKMCGYCSPSSAWALTDATEAPLTSTEGVVALMGVTALLKSTTTWGRSFAPS